MYIATHNDYPLNTYLRIIYVLKDPFAQGILLTSQMIRLAILEYEFT